MPPSKPAHARPYHTITTTRLVLRSGIPGDARAVATIRSDPQNNPHGGVHEPDLSSEMQAQQILKQQESTAEGKNAWVQIILKPEFTEHVVKELVVEDGIMVGMTGFNSFPTVSVKVDGEERGVVVGDTGAMIDHRYARKGFALEAMEAIFEYGFNELGCGMMHLDTSAANQPWRTLMKKLGLEDVEEIHTISNGSFEEATYKFDRAKWETCKVGLKKSGIWLL